MWNAFRNNVGDVGYAPNSKHRAAPFDHLVGASSAAGGKQVLKARPPRALGGWGALGARAVTVFQRNIAIKAAAPADSIELGKTGLTVGIDFATGAIC